MATKKKVKLQGGGKFGSIQEAKKRLKQGGGEHFVKFIGEDEDVMVRFLTEPDGWTGYREVFDEEVRMFRPLVEGDDGEASGGRFGPSKRVMTCVLDIEEGKVYPMKLPSSLADDLLARCEKRGTIMDRDFELTRRGKGTDTRYRFDPMDESKINLKKYKVVDTEEFLIGMYEEWEKAVSGEDDFDDDDIDDVDDDDEEEEEPRRKPKDKSGRAKPTTRKGSRRASRDEDEDEEEDEEDDDDLEDLDDDEDDDDDDDFDLDDDDDEDLDDDEESITVDLDALPDMKITALRTLAKEIGLKVSSKNRQVYIDAIEDAVT
jgi:hypothetical protein